MNYPVLIIVALAGIALGMYLARQKANMGFIAKSIDCAQGKQTEQKAENKQKILKLLQEHDPTSQSYEGLRKIQNNDVERLVGVSNATAERYLAELEKEGKLTQHGTIGQGVFYTLRVD